MFVPSYENPAYGVSDHVEAHARETRRTSKLSLHSLRELRALDDAVERLLCGEDGVEVRDVDRAGDGRLERRLNLLLEQLVEIDVFRKEGISLDLFRAVDTKPLCWVARKQASEDAARLRAYVVAEDERVLQDLLVHLLGVLCKCISWGKGPKRASKLTIIKRREARKHFVEEDTKRPPVDCLVCMLLSTIATGKNDLTLTVALAAQNLGGKVLRSTDESVGGIRILHVQLAQTEVAQSDVASVVKQDILRLQVAVDDI